MLCQAEIHKPGLQNPWEEISKLKYTFFKKYRNAASLKKKIKKTKKKWEISGYAA